MNPITEQEIKEMQENWKVWQGLSKRQQDVMLSVGKENLMLYLKGRWEREGISLYCSDICYRIVPEYKINKEPDFTDYPIRISHSFLFPIYIYFSGLPISSAIDIIDFIGYVYEDGTISKMLTDASKIKAVRIKKSEL